MILQLRSAIELLKEIDDQNWGWNCSDCIDQHFVRESIRILTRRYKKELKKNKHNEPKPNNLISSTCASLAYLAADYSAQDKAKIETALQVLEDNFLKNQEKK